MTTAIRMFTDGACSGNPGPGGWGTILLSPTGRVKELGGGAAHTTNNRMEMSAALEGLKCLAAAQKVSSKKIEIYTDSTYLIRGMSQWIFGWMRNNWKNAEGEEVTNRDLWEALQDVVKKNQFEIDWHYVRGHIGTPGNERCDEIAVAFAKSIPISLYDGPLEQYGEDLNRIPEDTKLPQSKAKTVARPENTIYLSYVGNKLYKDKDWKSCEARVKGTAGAKFKKVTSPSEEADVLKRWGLK
jgi:ribonuclease HI